MMNSVQEQITVLCNRVNELVSQAAYKTVDETYGAESSKETVIQTQLSDNNQRKTASSLNQDRSYSDHTHTPVRPHQQKDKQATAETPKLNTLQKTSTPKSPIKQKKSDRTSATPKLNQQSSQDNPATIESRSSQQRRNTPN